MIKKFCKTKKLLNKEEIPWDKIIELINLSSIEDKIIEHYMNTNNLDTRISFHDTFSVNKNDWFSWIFEQIDFSTVYRLLEIGCGNGKLWENNHYNLRNREIFLSDNSAGMVEETKQRLGDDYNYLIIDCNEFEHFLIN